MVNSIYANSDYSVIAGGYVNDIADIGQYATIPGGRMNSDRRIKRDIRSLTNAPETVARVRPVSFRYTDAYRAAHPGVADRDYVNVVAQEFEEVFPDYLKGSGESPPEGGGEESSRVDTYPLLIHGTAAIQELNHKVEHRSQKAEGRIQKLEAENGELKARLDRLEQLVTRQFAKGQ